MDDERAHAGARDDVDEPLQVALAILLVDADAAFDGDRHLDLPLHGRDAGGNKLRLRHQASSEAALLHAVGGAADVEIDLVVAERLANRRRLGERPWIGAAELQRNRMLEVAHGEQPRAVAVQDGRQPSPSRYRAARASSAGGGRPGSAGPSNPSWERRRTYAADARISLFSQCARTRTCTILLLLSSLAVPTHFGHDNLQ